MDSARKGQVTKSAADVYEEFFVPALFGEWGPKVSGAAKLAPGQRVLDIACGTGALARAAKDRVGPSGSVVGYDRNEGMLEVAARIRNDIEWQAGKAESLPFRDSEFDAVVSQFGLMFFENRVSAIAEMWRVLKSGGHLAVAVWARLEDVPGYAAMVELIDRLFGAEAGDALRAPYTLGDGDVLHALFDAAGVPEVTVESRDGEATFTSIAEWVHTDVRGWTLSDMIDDEQYQELRQEAERTLEHFVQEDGTVRFAHPALIIQAQKS